VISVFKEPPYEVREMGYGGFDIKIEVFFKKFWDVKRKFDFIYELYLPSQGLPPISHTQLEKLTFINPAREFRAMLVRNGGVRDFHKLHNFSSFVVFWKLL